ncbi:hypothetical protein [Desulforhabdus sp. TSK]|uniref:hypothetical protein n=1 Tax=Desulforhabdus sp. TSK TaxID=2925014 RepID=UPI001FC8A574|nr:hypothetical protein [Desulforhabdus sp. TSK]GKT09783.1 hypothetical protein DSTSK_30880 [Desulforhabdus sp. TSK]
MLENKDWLSYINLSDHYERKARFLPALISVLFLLPVSATLGKSLDGWISTFAMGVGVSAALAVGLSHLASAAGNRLQQRVWPRWPYDAPTNQWLFPNDKNRSNQQKALWYAAIKRLTGLDVVAAADLNDDEIEKIINDAVTTLRYRLRDGKHADRLRVHNADYGFTRNFAGLRFIWLPASVLSCAGCFASFYWTGRGIIWCAVSLVLLITAFLLARTILPNYVCQKARHYAESFWSAVLELDRDENGSAH